MQSSMHYMDVIDEREQESESWLTLIAFGRWKWKDDTINERIRTEYEIGVTLISP
jgi:hypothetical protein